MTRVHRSQVRGHRLPGVPRSLGPLLVAAAVVSGAAACAGRGAAIGALEADQAPATEATSVLWQAWTPETFASARASGKLILIGVSASWCHWCHVMDEKTYADPSVRALLARDFVAIRVDADARPDIAMRYARFGWPATIVLTPGAEELAGWRGYQSVEKLMPELEALVAARDEGHLEPKELIARPSAPSPDLELGTARARAAAQIDKSYDVEDFGWGEDQKYPVGSALEAALIRSALREEDDIWRERALETLRAIEALHDPEWGGIYQYSVGGVWTKPHFEKLTELQAAMLEAYATALASGSSPSDAEAFRASARGVSRYLDAFMKVSGGYGVSMDADLRPEGVEGHAGTTGGTTGGTMVGKDYYALSDAARRAEGLPRRDLAVHADVNGHLIAAFARMARVDPEEDWAMRAQALAESLSVTHRHPDGGFSHGPGAASGSPRYLADQAGMLWGFVQLYELTGERRWREAARDTAEVIRRDFAADDGGYLVVTRDRDATGVFARPPRPVEENGRIARAFLRLERSLDHARGDDYGYERDARSAVLALADPDVLRGQGRFVGEYLLAALELELPAVWVTVVGDAGTEGLAEMQATASRGWDARVLVDQSPPGEFYPGSARARVFICDRSRCSAPISDPSAVEGKLAAFLAEGTESRVAGR